jgi:hypothetical protein
MGTARRDDLTLDLFTVPQPAPSHPGSLDYRSQVSAMLSDELRKADGDRFDIAAKMSRLTGREVSKYMLDAYCAESREDFNIPFYLVPAVEVACETTAFSAWLAMVRGGRMSIGRDALAAELGKLDRQRDEINRKARALRKAMGENL